MKSSLKVDPALALLILAAFLIPLCGGQVSVETVALTGGPLSALNSLFGGSELPVLSHLLLALLVIGAFIWLLLSRRVVQTPNNILAAIVAIFFGVIVVTTAFSTFRALSVAMATEWLVYGFGFFAVVGLAGRRVGPTAIVTGLFAGCVVISVKGMQEYGEGKALDPTFRIFGGWNNPNALAAILLIGFFLGLGLTLTQERLKAMMAGAGTVAVGIALLLTQSKGALLALAVVGLIWAVTAMLLGKGRPASLEALPRGASAGRVAAIAACIALVAVLLQVQQHAPPGTPGGASGSVTGRLLSVGGSADQSAGFRRLLWQTSIDLIKLNPAGYGLGSFRFESGRPGLTTQTVFGHSTYLQLAAEGSVVLPLALILIVAAWLRLVFRGIRTLPAPTRTLLLSTVAAVGAILAHSFVDSDFYYFGVGLAVFMLIGLSVLLCADAVAPEFLFPAVRGTAAAFGFLVLVALGYFGVVQYFGAVARAEIEAGNLSEAGETLAMLHGLAPTDAEVWYMTAQTSRNSADAVAAAQTAVASAPSTRNYRLLARVQKDAGQTAAAETNYGRALILDPNSLTTLYQLAELQRGDGDTTGYEATLRRLIAVEDTNYFKVRSLPEMIPTETYQARIELADVTADHAEKRRLLTEAVAGFREYLTKTIPNVLRFSKGNPPMDFAGVSLDQAKEKLKLGADAARQLAALDTEAGDSAGAAEANKDADAFQAAL